MLDLIETLFARYGIRSLRYDGRMSREAREMTLAEFRQRGGPKVILVRYALDRARVLPLQTTHRLMLRV